jgi:hypothetical protein
MVAGLTDRQSKQTEMIPVTSSNLESIGYNEKTARLFVRFRDGGKVYYYDPTPAVVYLGLLHSRSKGSYLHTQVIPFFRCTRASESDLTKET